LLRRLLRSLSWSANTLSATRFYPNWRMPRWRSGEMSRLIGHWLNDIPHVVVHRIQIWTVRRSETNTEADYNEQLCSSWQPRRAFVKLLSHRIWSVHSLKVFANFIRGSTGSSEMSSWALSVITGVLTDFSFEWLFLIRLAERRSPKYLAASYKINLGYSKNRIISIFERPAQRLSIIATLRLYSAIDLICSDILKLCTLTYNHMTYLKVENDRPPKSNEAENSNLNLSAFSWRTLYFYIYKVSLKSQDYENLGKYVLQKNVSDKSCRV